MVRDSWSADDGRVFLSGTYFSSVTGSDFTADVTEISVAGGERDVEQTRCFGSGNNSFIHRKGQTLMEATIKMHMKNNDAWLAVAGGSYASGNPMQFTGDGTKYPVNVLYDFTDKYDVSGAQMQALFANAEATSFNFNMATDGTFEAELKLKCLPHNYTHKYTPNRVVSALS